MKSMNSIEVVDSEEGLRAKISKRNLLKSLDSLKLSFEDEKFFIREQLELIRSDINNLQTSDKLFSSRTTTEANFSVENLGDSQIENSGFVI